MSSAPGRAIGISPAELDSLRNRFGDRALRVQLDALARHGKVVDKPMLWLQTALTRDFKFRPIERVCNCPCGSNRIELLSRFVYWNLLGVTQCTECGLVFVSPRLRGDVTKQNFESRYLDVANADYWSTRRHPVFRDALRLLRAYGCESVFDVGAAFGHFVRFAERSGLRASGCDINPHAVEWGRRVLGVELHRGTVHDLRFGNRLFDCVISLDTFYYAADPFREARAMARLVQPNGSLILRLRNGARAAAQAMEQGAESVGRQVGPAEHLWFFTTDTITQILERAGLTVVRCEAAMPSASWWWLGEAGWTLVARRVNRLRQHGSALGARSFNVVAQV